MNYILSKGWTNRVLKLGAASASLLMLGCVPNLLDDSDEETDLPIEIPAGHSRVLALGSVFELTPQVALCYGPSSDCQSKAGPLLSATIRGDAAQLLSTQGSASEFQFPESDSLKVLARTEGDAVLTVSGELDDGTQVTRDINLLVRRPNRFEVDAQCNFVTAELVFLGGRTTTLRQKFYHGERLLEGEHPQALIADDLTRPPDAFLHDWFTFSPPEGERLVEFRSALVPDFSVKGQIYTPNQLRVSEMRISDPDRVRSPNAAVSIHASGFVDGREACTLPSFEATVLTPTVCGDGPKVFFDSAFFAKVSVFISGTCELEFTDSSGVQRFAFDIRVQAP